MIAKEELEVFKNLKDIKIVFDVGARDDLDYYYLKPDCEYHLFEPHIEFIGDLKAKLRAIKHLRPKVILNEFGLSDKKEILDYDEQTQSFVKRNKAWNSLSRKYPLDTLDDYCKRQKIKKIDFLKIDAEGMDYRILKGGENMLKNTRYVQVEWGVVKPLTEILKDFICFLIMEPELEKVMDKKYEPLPLLTEGLVDFLDTKLMPKGVGGNILGVRK